LTNLVCYGKLDGMYTRRLLPAIASPFADGKALQGAWAGPFETVDFSALDRPFAVRLPRRLSDLRVKEWQTFTVLAEDFAFEALIADLKFFCFADVVFTRGGERLHVFKTLPPFAWRLPLTLQNTDFAYSGGSFSFRVRGNPPPHAVSLELDIASAIERPAFSARLGFNMPPESTAPLAVSTPVAGQRPMYAYKALAGADGSLVWGDARTELADGRAVGLFQDRKGFFPYRSRLLCCRAFWTDALGRAIAFSLAEHPTLPRAAVNENALWVAGALTPLPPVRITPGADGEFVIQDIEGMVDLSFRMTEDMSKTVDLLLVKMERRAPVGSFTGMLVTGAGEKLPIRNLPGRMEIFGFRM
jgi:hypothetical protein